MDRPSGSEPFAFATTFQDGSDSAELLHLCGRAIAVTLRSECGQQAWREHRTGSGERLEEGKIRMRCRRLFNLPVRCGDALAESGYHFHQYSGHHYRGLNYGHIADRRDGLADLFQPLLNPLLTPAVVRNQK